MVFSAVDRYSAVIDIGFRKLGIAHELLQKIKQKDSQAFCFRVSNLVVTWLTLWEPLNVIYHFYNENNDFQILSARYVLKSLENPIFHLV